jgi:BNR repeat-like domain
VVPTDEPTGYERYRRVLVVPGLNEPEAYPGYRGFVGWEGLTRTRTGVLLLTFSSGYWHASPPTPLGAREKRLLEKYGIAEIDAPRGGRAHIMRSEDGGLTWGKPAVLIDTPGDDRAPAAVQLSDGTLVCSFFVWPPKMVGIIRSRDDGKTWEQEPRYLRNPFRWTGGDGPPIELPDRSVLMATYAGSGPEDGKMQQGIFRSMDQGATWHHLATLDAPFNLDEPHIAALPDGRLMTICRREGAVAWSDDQGKTWTAPLPLPLKIYDPWLLPLKDGTLLCVHGSYTEGRKGVRAILSPDGGKTWHAAGPDFGFAIDPSVYGYSRGVELDDGSIYLVYMANGGHKPEHMKSQRIIAIRIRVKAGCRGIELLPVPGAAAGPGK